MFITRRALAACTFAAFVFSQPAWGQSSSAEGQKPKKPPATQAADPDLLAGPSVEDEASDGMDNMQGPGGAQRRRAAEGLPLRQWLQQVRALDGITAEQQQTISSIMQDMEREQVAFRTEHGEEMRKLQEKIGQIRQGGREPDPALREQVQKLESEVPKPTEYQRRIWEALTPDQQAALRERIAALEQQMQQQQRRGGGDGAGRNPAPQAGTSGNAVKRAGGDESMTGNGAGDGDEMMQPSQGAIDRPNVREELQQRRRAAAAGAGADAQRGGLDDMARRRVEFLRLYVSTAAPARAGEVPSKNERQFQFDEDQ